MDRARKRFWKLDPNAYTSPRGFPDLAGPGAVSHRFRPSHLRQPQAEDQAYHRQRRARNLPEAIAILRYHITAAQNRRAKAEEQRQSAEAVRQIVEEREEEQLSEEEKDWIKEEEEEQVEEETLQVLEAEYDEDGNDLAIDQLIQRVNVRPERCVLRLFKNLPR